MPQALHRPPDLQTDASYRLTAALTDHEPIVMIAAIMAVQPHDQFLAAFVVTA
jgi:hypothetical protein